VSEPVGAFADTHEAAADLRVAEHNVTEPTEKATVPVGVPDAEEATLAL
jgi:hypothetical protein